MLVHGLTLIRVFLMTYATCHYPPHAPLWDRTEVFPVCNALDDVFQGRLTETITDPGQTVGKEEQQEGGAKLTANWPSSQISYWDNKKSLGTKLACFNMFQPQLDNSII